MKRRVIMIILILLTFVLQTTLMQTFAIASVSPNLPIVLTVSFALMRGKREGMFVGAFFGILMDIFYGPVLGFHMLLFTYVGYFNGFCYRIFYDDDIKMPVLLIAFSDLVYDLVVYLFQFFLRGRISLFFYLRRIIIPEVIYTALITLVVYRMLLALNHKLEKAEQRSVGSFV